jgi:excinuclease ABC subunit A
VDERAATIRWTHPDRTGGRIRARREAIARLVEVDQNRSAARRVRTSPPIPACSTRCRKLFAATKQARARRYDAGRFSFNVAKGRCDTCEGEGFVSIELLFMPSVFAPCPTCHGARYNAQTLEVLWRGKNIAQVLAMSVDEARAVLRRRSLLQRRCSALQAIGLGYCAWASRRPNCPAARRSASSWQPNCSGPSAATAVRAR